MGYNRKTSRPGKVYSKYIDLSDVDMILFENEAIREMDNERIFINNFLPNAYQQIAVVTVSEIIGIAPYGDRVQVYLRDTEIRVTKD